MRGTPAILTLAFALAGCAPLSARTAAPNSNDASTNCNTQAPGALVGRPTAVKEKPKLHTVVASSRMTLMEAKYVEGTCVDKIVEFAAGQATLSSGERFVIWDDGRVELYSPNHSPGDNRITIERITGFAGYRNIMSDRVRTSRSAAGTRESYVGLFRGQGDYVIARFDLKNGSPIGGPEFLIRSKFPISSVDFFPAPDTPSGEIAFVQPLGPGKAWLYGYTWDHSHLAD